MSALGWSVIAPHADLWATRDDAERAAQENDQVCVVVPADEYDARVAELERLRAVLAAVDVANHKRVER